MTAWTAIASSNNSVMTIAFSPAICHIDLGAIGRNFRRLSSLGKLMPVIKADAYGHGLLPVARTLAAAGAERFAVGGADEGAALRDAGHKEQILLLTGCQSREERETASRLGLVSVVSDFASLEKHAALGRDSLVAIKHDSGMGRLGFTLEDLPALLEKLRACPHIRPLLVISHLASADMPEDAAYLEGQSRSFEKFCDGIGAAFPEIERSLGNSAALLAHPRVKYDFFRPGIAIYGGNPLPGNAPAPELEWAMSVAAPILQVKKLKKGQSVSYGRIFTAPEDMPIAIVGCGYAQGLFRRLSGQCEMLVRGRRLPQIGRICMGMSILDAREMPDLQADELAYPLGGQAKTPESPISAAELAEKLETIPYEILCSMGSLNQRVYHA